MFTIVTLYILLVFFGSFVHAYQVWCIFSTFFYCCIQFICSFVEIYYRRHAIHAFFFVLIVLQCNANANQKIVEIAVIIDVSNTSNMSKKKIVQKI